MIMSWIWTGILLISIFSSLLTGSGSTLASATLQGAQAGISLAISIAGALCLWTGVGKLMERCGITGFLSGCLRPLLHLLFPESRSDTALAGDLSANI